MSIFAELSDEAVSILKAAGHEVVALVTTEADKALVFLKQSAENEPLVTKALNLISDLESKQLSGTDKMAKVVGDITDGVATALSEGGFGHFEAIAATMARGLAQMVFADFKASIAKL